MSRPRWSVPSQKRPPLGATESSGCMGLMLAVGEKGASNGANTATTIQNRTIATPSIANRLSRNKPIARTRRARPRDLDSSSPAAMVCSWGAAVI